MEFETGIAIGLAVVLILISLRLRAESVEKKLWNYGWCPNCHSRWKQFDTDSQGGRGYKCVCLPVRRIWISYAVDK